MANKEQKGTTNKKKPAKLTLKEKRVLRLSNVFRT